MNYTPTSHAAQAGIDLDKHDVVQRLRDLLEGAAAWSAGETARQKIYAALDLLNGTASPAPETAQADDELAEQAYRMLYSDPEYANQLALASVRADVLKFADDVYAAMRCFDGTWGRGSQEDRRHELEVAARTLANRLRAHAQQDAAPKYQAQFDGEYGSSVWHDVTEAAYHMFMPKHRRILYTAPSAAPGKAAAANAGDQPPKFHSKFGSPELCAAIVAHATSAADAKDAERIKALEAEIERYKRAGFSMSQTIHNITVGNQAAWIEWQHGDGAEAAMAWIHNGLVGPGLIPDEDEPNGKEAQAYADANSYHRTYDAAIAASQKGDRLREGDAMAAALAGSQKGGA